MIFISSTPTKSRLLTDRLFLVADNSLIYYHKNNLAVVVSNVLNVLGAENRNKQRRVGRTLCPRHSLLNNSKRFFVQTRRTPDITTYLHVLNAPDHRFYLITPASMYVHGSLHCKIVSNDSRNASKLLVMFTTSYHYGYYSMVKLKFRKFTNH